MFVKGISIPLVKVVGLEVNPLTYFFRFFFPKYAKATVLLNLVLVT